MVDKLSPPTTIPSFAILGHPNEGKSSVVSTLAENDSVRISPTPGETKKCREYPVIIDGQEYIRFIDTPGFQMPRQTLGWMKDFQHRFPGAGPEEMIVEFINGHLTDPDFADDCELLRPLSEGAGIIFVVDGSRPLRTIDRLEMDILRLTALPRILVINTKEQNRHEFLDNWKTEARKHFNFIRVFNTHLATYVERIRLLESLNSIDPDWQPALTEVIDAFKKDWEHRMHRTVQIILSLVRKALRHRSQKKIRDQENAEETKKKLSITFQEEIARFESAAHKDIKHLFKHNIFSYDLPAHSIVHAHLFSQKSWRVLGLKQWQLAAAGGAGGGAIGAKIDLALAGLSFGMFTAMGGLLGAGSAAIGARQALGAKVSGMPLGSIKIQVGPVQNDQLLFILIDRALIYFSHVINWAHSRRDSGSSALSDKSPPDAGYLSSLTGNQKQRFKQMFKAIRRNDVTRTEFLNATVQTDLMFILKRIST